MITMLCAGFSSPPDFIAEQKQYERVRTAMADKQKTVEQSLMTHDLRLDNFHVLFVAYKDTDEFEVYTRKKTGSVFRKLVSYDICARSGQLGPKRKRGDGQVPEGFYYINMFNPTSNFFLSLGINYPNTSDKRKTTASDPGGEIFIHGSCVTIGCLPMTDDKIKEIYLYAAHAKNNGQVKIPVYIYPFRMTDQNFVQYKVKHADNAALIDFWANLKTGYDIFSKDMFALPISFDSHGNYRFTTSSTPLQ